MVIFLTILLMQVTLKPIQMILKKLEAKWFYIYRFNENNLNS